MSELITSPFSSSSPPPVTWKSYVGTCLTSPAQNSVPEKCLLVTFLSEVSGALHKIVFARTWDTMGVQQTSDPSSRSEDCPVPPAGWCSAVRIETGGQERVLCIQRMLEGREGVMAITFQFCFLCDGEYENQEMIHFKGGTCLGASVGSSRPIRA